MGKNCYEHINIAIHILNLGSTECLFFVKAIGVQVNGDTGIKDLPWGDPKLDVLFVVTPRCKYSY